MTYADYFRASIGRAARQTDFVHDGIIVQIVAHKQDVGGVNIVGLHVISERLHLVSRRRVELFDAQFGQTVLNAATFSTRNDADIVAFLNCSSQGVPIAAVKTSEKIAPLSNDEFAEIGRAHV